MDDNTNHAIEVSTHQEVELLSYPWLGDFAPHFLCRPSIIRVTPTPRILPSSNPQGSDGCLEWNVGLECSTLNRDGVEPEGNESMLPDSPPVIQNSTFSKWN